MGDFGAYPVNESKTAVFTAEIQDTDGQAIPAASLLTLTLTLYEQATEAIINSRDGSNVLNANGGTVDALGQFTMVFSSADNQHMGTATTETHVALFQWTYNVDMAGSQRLLLTITNEPKVS